MIANGPTSIAALWRYPVKSMRGETVSSLTVDDHGVVGDRILALRLADGKLASSKTTRHYCHVQGLLQFRAITGDSGRVFIIFPDGHMRAATDPAVNHELSRFLNIKVELALENETPHRDAAALHLLSEAALTLTSADSLDQTKLDVRRFRPNLVLACGEAVENSWVGQIIKVGDALLLKIDYRTERCVMITLEQDDLPSNPGLLRVLANHGNLYLGVYAHVIRPGTISVGDRVRPVSSELTTQYHRVLNGMRRRIRRRLEIRC